MKASKALVTGKSVLKARFGLELQNKAHSGEAQNLKAPQVPRRPSSRFGVRDDAGVLKTGWQWES